ncbi:MAG: prefoldin subunit alpha [Candidatus Micrarchaeota archaeon]|nr:prefoldin subunit alpha [Candidatus Micrarchaeota archaeon]
MADNKGSGRKLTREELAYVQQVYQNQYVMTGNAINAALGELQELSSAGKALEEIGMVSGKASLSGIGGDFYLKSKIETNTKVLVGIGAGFLVEKEIDAARETIKARVDAKNEMVNKLVKSRKEIEAAMLGMQSGSEPNQSSE